MHCKFLQKHTCGRLSPCCHVSHTMADLRNRPTCTKKQISNPVCTRRLETAATVSLSCTFATAMYHRSVTANIAIAPAAREAEQAKVCWAPWQTPPRLRPSQSTPAVLPLPMELLNWSNQYRQRSWALCNGRPADSDSPICNAAASHCAWNLLSPHMRNVSTRCYGMPRPRSQ